MNNVNTMDSYGETEDGKLFYKKNEGKTIIFENHAYECAPLARLSFAYDRSKQDPAQKSIFLTLLEEYYEQQKNSPRLPLATNQNNQNTQLMTKRKHYQMITLYQRNRNNQHQRHIE